jgi:hypothetical protein
MGSPDQIPTLGRDTPKSDQGTLSAQAQRYLRSIWLLRGRPIRGDISTRKILRTQLRRAYGIASIGPESGYNSCQPEGII